MPLLRARGSALTQGGRRQQWQQGMGRKDHVAAKMACAGLVICSGTGWTDFKSRKAYRRSDPSFPSGFTYMTAYRPHMFSPLMRLLLAQLCKAMLLPYFAIDAQQKQVK